MWLNPHTYPQLVKLAGYYQKPLNIFDLETTGLHGPGFGITEIGGMLIHPDGRTWVYSELIHPGAGRYIVKPVQILTGITMGMLTHAPEWNARWAAHFTRFAQEHILTGFNVKFDMGGVLTQNERYGHEFRAGCSFDTRQVYWRAKNKSLNSPGSLSNLFKTEGLSTSGKAHRALADVIMTAMLLNKVLEDSNSCQISSDLMGPYPSIKAPGKSGLPQVAILNSNTN